MIIKINFEGSWTMCFGDSYKSWKEQLTEYVQYRKENFHFADLSPAVEYSNAKWVGMGGLKWCSFENLREGLAREHRENEHIIWHAAPPKITKKVEAILQRYGTKAKASGVETQRTPPNPKGSGIRAGDLL